MIYFSSVEQSISFLNFPQIIITVLSILVNIYISSLKIFSIGFISRKSIVEIKKYEKVISASS